MTDILTDILARKQADILAWRTGSTLAQLDQAARSQSPPRGFAASLAKASSGTGFGLIAEIKKASPSHGLIRTEFDPAGLAETYAAAGACCLSVLTDTPYFQGKNADLVAARAAARLPVLRKDFIIDPWQIAEARAIGADCILLIMAALDGGHAAELEQAALERGLDVLVEIHDSAELDRALRLKSRLIGINNRNLKTLRTSLETSITLARRIPADRFVISESGIGSHTDIIHMAEAGIRCFLVGESLLRHRDVAAATSALLGTAR